MGETRRPVDGDPLRPILPTDIEAHQRLAERIGDQPWMWDDRIRVESGVDLPDGTHLDEGQIASAYYISTYAHPDSFVLDVMDGAGVFAAARVVPGWRAQAFVAAWERRALGRDVTWLWRQAAATAMLARNLLVIDALVAAPNALGRRLATRCGMRERGLLRKGMCYHGDVVDLVWFEIDRSALGLPPP